MIYHKYENKIIEYVENNGPVSALGISKSLKLNRITVKKYLIRLVSTRRVSILHVHKKLNLYFVGGFND